MEGGHGRYISSKATRRGHHWQFAGSCPRQGIVKRPSPYNKAHIGWYCKTHDPELRQKKAEERRLEREKQNKERSDKGAEKRAHAYAAQLACMELSTDQLNAGIVEKMTAYFSEPDEALLKEIQSILEQ